MTRLMKLKGERMSKYVRSPMLDRLTVSRPMHISSCQSSSLVHTSDIQLCNLGLKKLLRCHRLLRRGQRPRNNRCRKCGSCHRKRKFPELLGNNDRKFWQLLKLSVAAELTTDQMCKRRGCDC